MMCKDMAEELAHFDLQKEKELKQVLLEYTAAQLERHEKVCVESRRRGEERGRVEEGEIDRVREGSWRSRG